MAREYSLPPGNGLDPRLQRSLPVASINGQVADLQRQLRAGQITAEMYDDCHRKLYGEWLIHQFEHADDAWREGWYALPRAQQEEYLSYTKGLNNGNASDESVAKRQTLALDRGVLNSAYRMTDERIIGTDSYIALCESKAPEVCRRARIKIGLGEEVEGSLDGQLKPLTTEEQRLKVARAYAALDRGEELADERPPPKPAPAPRTYARGRSEFSDFDMDKYVQRRDREEEQARKARDYEDGPDEEEPDPGPTEI
jgi:hypothetical protein